MPDAPAHPDAAPISHAADSHATDSRTAPAPQADAARAAGQCDVLIMGGGLAGLSLALQLRQRCPELDILVLERRQHPVPVATHKVGESTVELAAHYFAEVLGLREHLEQHQLRKFGFRFFFSDGQRELAAVTEVGASVALPMVSYQIDRGIFENMLAERVQQAGIRLADSARVTALALAKDDGEHQVDWLQAGQTHRTRCRWVIDACGRAGLIKRQKALAQPNGHDCHAVWFRMRHRIRIDDWSDDPAWRERCTPAERWRSTNHLVGPGYWVWLIPLSSGSHSVGIVADPRWHPLSTMDSFDKAMDWLQQRQPCLFEALDGQRETLQDFAFLRSFSYGCKQVFSGERWALTGEAGLFLDPFYSPGSDFIAMANTAITELVLRERAGHRVQAQAQVYDQIYQSVYESTLALYRDQYALFGDPEVLPVKVIWDYSYYWGVLSPLFVHGRLTDVKLLSQLREPLARCRALNTAVQQLLREWGRLSPRRNPPRMLDQAALPWFVALNAALMAPPADDPAFCQRLHQAARMLQELALELADRMQQTCPAPDPEATAALAALRALIDADITVPVPPRLFEAEPALAAAEPG
ncbi:NAD(P)/FAD-dependent oxidoreductase [Aquabacterium sp. OR-4]|uniref:NAD(P)/FAD-dependent oxidoreductase n=1 Tax=Aquabacterium sp. OR-4 TaxID=2978127 RepID=UPI0021B37AB8|nr:NAD(P)/FAD-dependent oxidoreductase [Aquabacterium sp. OR-4]MDT7836735.1 NAD(P)/FAD-dependent oxidoreductase [Aquabacterium sp. OR-4]